MVSPTSLTDGSWQDRAFVTVIRKDDQNSIDIHGITDEFGFGDGSKDFEGQPISNGGRIRERSAEEDATLNATIYAVGASVDDYANYARPRGLEEFFYESGDQNTDKENVSEYTNTLTRKDYLYVVMWTDDPNVTSATDSVGEDFYAYRRISDNVQWIDATPDWSDEVLKLEVEGKRSAFDPAGKPNELIQEKTASDTETLFRVGVNSDGEFVKFDETDTEQTVSYF